MTNVTITPTDNGPYLVEGPVRILDADGTAYDLPEQTAIFLWRFEAAHRVGHSAGAS